jgi:DNA-binding transcriptional ArsR family regulator
VLRCRPHVSPSVPEVGLVAVAAVIRAGYPANASTPVEVIGAYTGVMSDARGLSLARSGESVPTGGDANIAAVGAVLADPGRCQMLLALADGRALPASRLAWEAGVSAATASSHLARMVGVGLLTVEPQGRHRYYRLAGPQVGDLIEVLTRLAPPQPIRSLRQDTRAHALRQARTCYDHLAGRLGVALMGSMLERGMLTGGDGTVDPDRAAHDRRTGHELDIDYRLTADGHAVLGDLGIALPPRPVIRYCVDWSEQRHHLAGAVGRQLLSRLTDMGWIRPSEATRAVRVTEVGRAGLRDLFAVEVGDADIRRCGNPAKGSRAER